MTPDVRGGPRVVHKGDMRIPLGSRLAVRIVNISMTGVLLEANDGTAGFGRGDRLELTVPLGAAGFSAKLEVGRADRLPDGRNGSRRRIACAFVDLDLARRQQLAAFLADGLVPSRTDLAE